MTSFEGGVGALDCLEIKPHWSASGCVVNAATWCSDFSVQRARLGTLLRRYRIERGPALLHVLAAAMRAGDLLVLVLGNRQDFRKNLLAGVADKLIKGHSGVTDYWAWSQLAKAMRLNTVTIQPNAAQLMRMLRRSCSMLLSLLISHHLGTRSGNPALLWDFSSFAPGTRAFFPP